MRAHIAGWEGAVDVWLYDKDGKDYVRVELGKHMGHGTDQVLYEGPVAGKAA